jgi:hypothetical protein
MQTDILALPNPGRYGFTCKVWLAAELDRVLGDRYFVWFSTELDPIDNGDSSNPLELYRMLDRAVKRKDWNHPKVKNLRAKLLVAIDQEIAPRDSQLAIRLIRDIESSTIEMFRPQLWRIDLSKVAPERWDTKDRQEGWNEQLVKDLARDEFEVIVD